MSLQSDYLPRSEREAGEPKREWKRALLPRGSGRNGCFPGRNGSFMGLKGSFGGPFGSFIQEVPFYPP